MSRSAPTEYQVRAEDDVVLHARAEGRADAPVTVVLTHGFGMHSACWRFPLAPLARGARVVSWDQRGHGRSGYGTMGQASIARLGRDLRAVLDHCAPDEAVVLVGHSMGGMTIMALAAEHPELFGDRVTGVMLVATSATPVGIPSLGLLSGAVTYRAIGHAACALESATRMLGRRPTHASVVRAMVRRFGFASPVPDAVLDSVADMLLATPTAVLADVLPCFAAHNQLATLAALRQVPTVVLVGDRDAITPPRHSREIAAALPDARLSVVPNAGHMLPLERPDLINSCLTSIGTGALPRAGGVRLATPGSRPRRAL